MVKINKEFYSVIDVENLFNQWHPDVKEFTSKLNKEYVLNILKSTPPSFFNISKYQEVLNLTNSKYCKTLLLRILREKNTNKFINLLKERDETHPRDISRGYSIEEVLQSVEDSSYHPILFLELNKKLYIIDGRTRFYCCLFLNVPAKVRIISDNELNRKCNTKAHL